MKNAIIENKSLLPDHADPLMKLIDISTNINRRNNQHRALSMAIGSILENSAKHSELHADYELESVHELIALSVEVTKVVDELNCELAEILLEIQKDKN